MVPQTVSFRRNAELQKCENSVRQTILPKTDARYWLQPGKLKKWNRSATYSIYIQNKGQRHSFTLGSANREVAARLAAGICNDLVILGVEATLAKHRPQRLAKVSIATVGGWIESARKVSSAKTTTFEDYARCLRAIVSGVLDMRKNTKRFSPHKGGGAAKYRAVVDATSLDILTLSAIQKWRLEYVANATNPLKKQSAMTSCNSMVRQASSLFSSKILKFLPKTLLPDPIPFTDVEFFPRQNFRYISKIDPKVILPAAHSELYKKEPATFLALLLALGAGLRKGEIDSLQWKQINTERGVISVEVTESADLKTQDSQGEVEIDEILASLLLRHRTKVKAKDSDFVIDCAPKKKQTTRRSYRAEEVFGKLTAWLRAHGVTARKPIHEMRKELGALITQEHGIYAASRILRHSNVATTADHYADKKGRTTVPIGSWITPAMKAAPKRISKKAKPAKPSPARRKTGFPQ